MKVLNLYKICFNVFLVISTNTFKRTPVIEALPHAPIESSSSSSLLTTYKSTQAVTTARADVTTVSTPSTTTRATSTTTKKQLSPKKYSTPPEKVTSNGPTKIVLSKPSFKVQQQQPPAKPIALTCPKENEAQFNLFAPPCQYDKDCTAWNKEERCCNLFGSKNCIKGVPKPPEEPRHNPAFFGLIPRRCPSRPLAELWWDVKTCDTDDNCWPRICCPDGAKKYCRASAIEYSAVPLSFGRPIAYFSEYLECTPAPPPVFDIHPKPCNSTLDCFPNVCCQEAGKRHCRPPKKSLLTFMANFFNTGLLKRFTTNLVIR